MVDLLCWICVSVLKSDNANGVFGFSGPCDPVATTQEDAVFSCPVFRERGDADAVSVTWRVLQRIGAEELIASDDFLKAEGQLVFRPGERNKVGATTRL